jgi:hypothetical protein
MYLLICLWFLADIIAIPSIAWDTPHPVNTNDIVSLMIYTFIYNYAWFMVLDLISRKFRAYAYSKVRKL